MLETNVGELVAQGLARSYSNREARQLIQLVRKLDLSTFLLQTDEIRIGRIAHR